MKAGFLWCILCVPALGQLGSTPSQRSIINQDQVAKVINASRVYGNNIGKAFNIAVTDPSGFLTGFLRMDDAFLASTEISIDKARTVALFNGNWTTRELYNATLPGGPFYGSLNITSNGVVLPL